GAVERGRGRGLERAGKELAVLGSGPEPGFQEPQQLAADADPSLIGVPGVYESGVTEPIGPRRRQSRLRSGLPIGAPRALRLLDTAKDHHVDDAAAPELRGGGRVTPARPHRRTRLLPRP